MKEKKKKKEIYYKNNHTNAKHSRTRISNRPDFTKGSF